MGSPTRHRICAFGGLRKPTGPAQDLNPKQLVLEPGSRDPDPLFPGGQRPGIRQSADDPGLPWLPVVVTGPCAPKGGPKGPWELPAFLFQKALGQKPVSQPASLVKGEYGVISVGVAESRSTPNRLVDAIVAVSTGGALVDLGKEQAIGKSGWSAFQVRLAKVEAAFDAELLANSSTQTAWSFDFLHLGHDGVSPF